MAGKVKKAFLIAASLSVSACLYAASSDLIGGSFIDDGIAARPAGLGGAYTAIADDGNAAWWNPSGLGLLDKKKSLSFTYVPDMYKLTTGSMTRMLVTYAQGDTGGYGGVGGSISYLSINIGSDFSGDPEKTWTELVVEGSWGMEIEQYFGLVKYKYPKISIGANLKYMSATTDLTLNGAEMGASGYGADLGLLIAVKNNFNIGIMAKNILSQITWKGGTNEQTPYSINGGFFYGITPDFLVSAEVKTSQSDSGTPRIEAYCGGGEFIIRFPKSFSVQNAALRAGVSVDPNDGSYIIAAGASAGMEGFSVDLAYQYYLKSALTQDIYRLGVTAYF